MTNPLQSLDFVSNVREATDDADYDFIVETNRTCIRVDDHVCTVENLAGTVVRIHSRGANGLQNLHVTASQNRDVKP